MNKKVLACALASFVVTQSTPACRNVSSISGGRIALNVVSGGVKTTLLCASAVCAERKERYIIAQKTQRA